MLLQSVLDLKAELRAVVVGEAPASGFAKAQGSSAALLSGVHSPGLASLGSRATRPASAPQPAPNALGVAIGVAPGNGPRDYRVAVRTTRDDPAVSSYVAFLNSKARGETDVKHVGVIRTLQVAGGAQPSVWQSRQRPLRPGYSVGHRQTTAGTIGAFVKKYGLTLVLSNNHVLALMNVAKRYDPIVQPGPIDSGTYPQDEIARLHDWIPLQPEQNLVDAALAAIDPSANVDPTYDGHQLGAPVPPQLGQEVWKIGRTTGVTRGVVSAIALDDLPVAIGAGSVFFDNQIEIVDGDAGRFSRGGDSGALILDSANDAFGLLFAGTEPDLDAPSPAKTYANPVTEVLTQLDATLLG